MVPDYELAVFDRYLLLEYNCFLSFEDYYEKTKTPLPVDETDSDAGENRRETV